MSGVWVFKSGVAKLVQNPGVEAIDGAQVERWMKQRHESKVLVWLPSKQVIRSYADLEEKLLLLGWRRYIRQSGADVAAADHENQHNIMEYGPCSCSCCCSYMSTAGTASTTQSTLISDQDQLLQQLRQVGVGPPGTAPLAQHPHHELQFHRNCSSSLLISLPADFRNFKSMHMFDIVLKNRHHFEVRDAN